MPECRKCHEHFPVKAKVDGKVRNLQSRKYCLKCSPFGSGNTKKLEMPALSADEKKQRDMAKYVRWQRKARRERKAKLVEMAGGRCVICKYKKCLKALEFHHMNMDEKTEKSFGFSSKGMLARWDKLVEELPKCILVCCRCHREIHDGMHAEYDKSETCVG